MPRFPAYPFSSKPDFAVGEEIFAPLQQARQCLDRWLAEENRSMPAYDRSRASALIARYFLYEDQVTDDLILSFLRHYAGKRMVDLDDPASVRRELKGLLDRSVIKRRNDDSEIRHSIAAFAAGILICLLLVGGWKASQMTLTPLQQAELRMLVDRIADSSGTRAHAAIWATVKRQQGVRRYQDISYWAFGDSKRQLEKLLP